MAGYTEPSHSYKVKIQSLEDEKREGEGTRKKEKGKRKRGEKKKRLTDPGNGVSWPLEPELFSFSFAVALENMSDEKRWPLMCDTRPRDTGMQGNRAPARGCI